MLPRPLITAERAARLKQAALNSLRSQIPPAAVIRMLGPQQTAMCTVLRPSGEFVHVDTEFLGLHRFTAEDLLGRPQTVVQSSSQSALVYQQMGDLLRAGRSWWGETCNRSADDSLRWLEGFVAPVADEGETFHVGLYRDNTAGHRTDSSLQLHDLVLEQMAEAVVIADGRQADLPVIYANEAWSRMTGYALNEIVGCNSRFMQGTGTDETTVNRIRQSLQDHHVFRGEVLNYRKDGTPFWNELEIRPVHGQGGELTHFVGTCNDVTERRLFRAQSEFEEAILKRLARGQALDDVLREIVCAVERQFPSLKSSIFLVDREDKALVARCAPSLPEAFLMLGDGMRVSAEGVLGARAAAIGQIEIMTDLRQLPAGALREQALAQGFRAGWATPIFSVGDSAIGTMVTFAGSARAPTEAEKSFGQVAAGLASIAIERWQDEEVRTHLERQLRRAQKMEAVGTLAGGIAHDFNNILTGIFGFVQLAREDLPPDHSANTWLEEVMAAAMRARDVVRQILTFSRQQEQEVAPCDIAAVTAEALKLIRSVLPSSIELTLEPAKELPIVKADPVQVHQAMVNLCTNAWHAIPDGAGTITVRLIDTVLPRDGLAMPTDLKEGRYVCITVSDSGEGMSAAMMDRIFEPFFTTKPTGKGSGLGLAVVHGIMQAQNGGVLVESEEGKGSTFYLAFPVENIAPPPPAPARPVIIKGDGQSLLLVDDEKPIVGWLRALLKRSGYTVEGFVQPIEALAAFEANPSGYDLVLTDLTMPGLTGVDLARRIRKIRSDIPVLLMSGYDDIAAPDHLFDAGVDEVLRKPLMAETLTTAIHRVLHEPSRRK